MLADSAREVDGWYASYVGSLTESESPMRLRIFWNTRREGLLKAGKSKRWRARRDSNSRPSGSKPDALSN